MRLEILRCPFLLAALLAGHATFAHEIRPAYLEITEQTSHRFDIVWKQPVIGDVAIRLNQAGVPMAGDLPVKSVASKAPEFVVWAIKDPNGANLDLAQAVKVWVADGQHHEKVFDVAYAGDRKPDPSTGKVPAVGNTVDLKTATYANDIGSTELKAVWQDPEFDPALPAVYYLRVLEIPTPRWTTIQADGQPLPADTPSTIQECGWSSPIWYTPKKSNAA